MLFGITLSTAILVGMGAGWLGSTALYLLSCILIALSVYIEKKNM